ncbi:MAG: hypothetical protein LUG54_01180, partial [Clostridiales bacterium]|nr:hypothetical protein [Clostridiales bacterium]
MTLENVIVDANSLNRCAHVAAGAVLILGNGAVLQNGYAATSSTTTYPTTCGGGVYAEGTLCMYKGSKIINNDVGTSTSYPSGLGVYLTGRTAKFYMYGGEISNNDHIGTYNGGYGGGVYAGYYAELYLYGGAISNNDTTFMGAGIYATNYVKLVIGRSADEEMPSDSVCDEQMVIENNTITDVGEKSATYVPNGAGIFCTTDCTLLIQAVNDEDTVIRNNQITAAIDDSGRSRDNGGGLYISSSTVTMTGGTISGNSVSVETEVAEEDDAACVNGGGIYVASGTFDMTGGKITNNSVSCTWSSNAYAGVGGGLYVGSSATVTLTGGTISENIAVRGNDIYLRTTSSASGLLYVGGDVSIADIYLSAAVLDTDSDDSDEESSDNILKPAAVLHMASALTSQNAIGVTVEDPQAGSVIVEGEEDGYALGYADEASFYCTGDDETYEIRLDSDGNLSLQETTTATYLAKAKVTFAEEDQTLTYTGEKQTLEPTVTLNGETLVKGTDYILTYSNNVDAGTATVTVNGIGSYTGATTATFTIEPLDISTSEDITIDAIDDQIYTGNAMEPSVTVYYNGETLTQGDAYDYSVAYTDNTDLGIATVTITGHGNFTGSIETTFNIMDTEGTTVVSDGVTLERVIEAASGTSEEDPLIITLATDVTLEVTEATEESEDTETTEEDSESTDEEAEVLAATDAMITLPEGEYVQILGYNHTITVGTDCFATEDASETGMFIVTDGSELTLESVTLDGQYHERLLYVMNDGNAEVGEGATLTRGRATDITGGVESQAAITGGQAIWNAGTVTFEGSLSTNRTTSNYFGAVYNAADGSFTMTDTAQIEDIYVCRGAVYNVGTFTMEGGVITDTSTLPGLLYSNPMAVNNIGTFTMKDGSITENTTGGATVLNTGTFLMEGGEISLNDTNLTTYEGGTIDVADGIFTMTGGSVTGNQSQVGGGGFYISGGIVTIDGENAEISGNQAVNDLSNSAKSTSVGGGVYMCGGELNIIKGSIVDNTAYFAGMDTDTGQGGTIDNSTKYAHFGDVYSSDGVYTYDETFSYMGHNDSDYGVGGAIFVDSGILTICDGAVIEGNYSPIACACGIVIAEDLFITNEDEASQFYLSGSPQISDTIWLDEGKSILINGELGDGDETYQVYQQETDFKLVENGGTAAARYTDESYMNEDDGDKFTVYPYDAEWDFEADSTLDHYTALSSEITGSSAGIYANYAAIDLSEISYAFTDADSTDESGTAQYKYNGFPTNPTIQATAALGTGDDEQVIDMTKNLTFTHDYAVSAGDYTVTVTADSYHITDANGEGYKLTFRIIPVDLSDPGEASDRWQVEVEADDVAYDTAYPEGELTETTLTARVRLGTVNWTDLVQADSADSETGDYYVTWENNDQAGTATAVIHGINNYTGETSVTFEITAVEEDNSDDGEDSSGTTAGADTLVVRRGNAFYFSYTLKSGAADKVIYYGTSADEVLIGDWDGDGVDTICVRRGNTYYIANSLKSGAADVVIAYGKATDEVLVGDWDGDGKDTLAVRRGNTYYIANSLKSGSADSVIAYGKATDTVLVGKWSGNASGTGGVKDTLAVRRGNTYYFSNSLKSGSADKVVAYGKATDEVLSGDWDGDGYDTLTVRRGNVYYFSNTIKSGSADTVIAYGKATDEVYVGT